MKKPFYLFIALTALSYFGCAEKSSAPASATTGSNAKQASTNDAISRASEAPKVVKATPAITPVKKIEKEDNSPTAVIQRYTEQLRLLVGPEEKQEKGIKDKEKEEKIANKVREFFDFQTLARLSLGRHWNRVTPAQKKEFTSLFIGLIEDSYIRRSRDLVGNYDIKYRGEKITKERAKVTSSVIRTDANVDIVYELHLKKTNWMIFNIILDDVDLIRNYQSQFNSIIGKSTFNGLLKKMRKKLDEVERGVADEL